jgi:hypothetical protein
MSFLWRALATILLLTCRQAATLLSQAEDRRLAAHHRAAVAVHLITCRSCRRYRRQLVALRQLLALMGDAAPVYGGAQRLSPQAAARVRSVLERRAEGS